MGYTTNFKGKFELDHELTDNLYNYLKAFSEIRHMKRNNKKIKEIYPDWEQHCFNGNLGIDGEYFTRDDGNFGQSYDDSIINYNMPADSQPGLWCDWTVTDDKKFIEWNKAEKFYDYIEWLYYIIGNFLEPNNYLLNGEIAWQGEEPDDVGTISVTNNEISILAKVDSNIARRNILTNKCPICESNMEFNAYDNKFVCEYCGTSCIINM